MLYSAARILVLLIYYYQSYADTLLASMPTLCLVTTSTPSLYSAPAIRALPIRIAADASRTGISP